MKQRKIYCTVYTILLIHLLTACNAISNIKIETNAVWREETESILSNVDLLNSKANILGTEYKVLNKNNNVLSERNPQSAPGLDKLRNLSQDIDAIKFTKSSSMHNGQETNIHDNVMHGFDKHDFMVPIRIHHETGMPHTHGKHFRARRSTNIENDFDDSEIEHKVANFTFSAFGESFSIHLTPKSDFIAPTYSLQFMGNLTSSSAEHLEELPRHCFYSGHVNNDTTHTVVVSLCGGLFGAFRTNIADYIIQPHGDDMHNDITDELATKRHKIFKRSVDAEKKSKELCGFKEQDEMNDHDGRRINPARIHHRNKRSRQRRSSHGKKRSRSKRYLSYPRHVEVMVTADNLMYRTHGHNLHHYVLTLMAIVNHIYLDPSIGNLINIVLVKLIVVTDEQSERGPHVTKNAHQCLRNFCRWQATQNNPDDSHPDHHDTAVLITRQDICRTENACDTLGLAEMGTMCDHYRSCSINEDNGLSTAFTIAHEIGHEFNAPHDNNDKCRTSQGYPEALHVMSPQLDHNAKPWSWSQCSSKHITNFLDFGNGQCLLDDPPQRVLPLPLEQPGQIFDVNSQCGFVYGKGVTHCGFMNTCGRLWCVSKDRGGGCRTPHMPWADGTRCGPGKWCQRGSCVNENKHLTPIKGSWGGWTEFGACSKQCGGGIQIATRDCANPAPANGGKFCVGRRKKFRSCAPNECTDERDFRAEQCSKYDHWANNHSGQRIRGIPSNVRWIPKYDGIMLQDRCKLICQIKTSDEYTAPWYVLHPKVLNGTPCGPNTHDICVEGICKKAGCDHVLNSNTKEDDCGVCGGDNTGCNTIKSSYNLGNREGYRKVVVLPVGATNILIQQTSYQNTADDNNFLALRDSHGHYILNGGKSVVQYKHRIFKRSHHGPGMMYDFDYSGTDNVIEVLNSSTPLKESITVEILQAGDLMPPNIKYKYNVPSLTHTTSYHWDPYGPWGECSRICQGNSKRKVLCKSADNKIVSDSHCDERNKPTSIKQYCNTDCEIRWHVNKIECSSRCGEGVETKHSKCVKASTSEDGRRQIEDLPDKECTSPKPTSGAVCHGNCLPTRWEYDDWSQCTKTCDGGLQKRRAICRDVRGMELSPQECKSSVRVVSQTCNNQPCPQWVTSSFSECSATCGSYSVRSRRVWCRSASRTIESNDKCNPLRKPLSTVTCNVVACPTWRYHQWQPCSVSCGVGTSMRRVTCVDYHGNQVDENQCDSATREVDIKDCVIETDCYVLKPPVQRHADMVIVNRRAGYYHSTGSQWRTGDWTSCSTTCGQGTQERYVSCRNNELVQQDDCPAPTPPRIQDCNMGPCSTAEWRSSAWSDCTTTCGQGTMTRFVWCVQDNRNTIDERPCRDVAQKPVTVSTCLLKPCTTAQVSTMMVQVTRPYYPGIWRHGPFSQCSSSCGPGIRRRLVQCQPLNQCDPSTKPRSTETCDAVKCPEWKVSAWQQCTKSCGGGTQYRHVVCAMSDGTYTLDEHCELMDKPTDTQPCNVTDCPGNKYKWKTYKWSECSQSCEKGYRTRHVACVNENDSIVDEAFCSEIRLNKPRTKRGCRLQRRCPRWRSAKWSRCSTSCGAGTRVRRVTCRYKRKTILDIFCDASTKPQTTVACSSSPCHTYTWKMSSWGRCSAYCGTGYKTRTVSCMSDRQIAIMSKCPQPKPAEREICKIQDCPSVWWTDTWSECSRTCGRGVQTRKVLCVRKDVGTQQVMDPTSCNGRKQLENRDCNHNVCSSDVQWKVGIWGECSVTCGSGSRSRRVYCVRKSTNHEIPIQYCDNTASFKPDSQISCRLDPCLPTSCYDAKTQLRQHLDGEYQLLVQGRVTKIYCKDMDTFHPTEFLTLPDDGEETYSEMYKYRLLDSTTCPLNDDDSQRFTHSQAGKTIFKKVRIDIMEMKIITGDFSFATTLHGIPTEVGVAGDCYSQVQCPRGSFRINLKNTGFAISERTTWVSYGRAASRETVRDEDGSSVYGKCGGYCSRCQPDPYSGILLIHSRET